VDQFTIKRRGRKLFLISLILLPFIMPSKPELIPLIDGIIWVGYFLLLLRYFWRYNPWSYLFGIMGFYIISKILLDYHTIHVPDYRHHFLAVILCIGLFFLYFLKEAFFKQQIVNK
tara:strand:- start:74 stop:421 length:348 start_codon:yes stop_codon:yes gene_type:complete